MTLHARRSVAPLKLPLPNPSLKGFAISPRSKERGSVEASVGVVLIFKTTPSPRSKERGSVEASALRDHGIPSALSPRSKERGSVEAILPPFPPGPPRPALHARRSVAPLKPWVPCRTSSPGTALHARRSVAPLKQAQGPRK
ncbi:hypothetical protein DES53_112110 [Roseimicrobium gellanilyticum]|uniref:Uncharacterized protein n=1 Tax=Roseimicrobium gellanilyticum TaxID=748857 RepID=A0A366H7G6_9BACT|nr:hypothetical protein DES53_112110 [Roseimicrobium gellanilyticum]